MTAVTIMAVIATTVIMAVITAIAVTAAAYSNC